MLPTPEKAKDARGFVFRRGGKTVLACWHMSGSGTLKIALDAGGVREVPLAGIRYVETEMAPESVKAAYAAAEMK